MAATNFTPISLYYSTTASAVPTSGNLVAGELALNTLDEKLYFKNSAGTVKLLASNAASTGTVSSVAATVPSFLSIAGSPITTSGTLAFSLSGTALPTTSGGTGLTSFTSGGVVYASSSSALATGTGLNFNGNLNLGGTALTGTYGRDFSISDSGNDAYSSFGIKGLAANNGNNYYTFNAVNTGAFTWAYRGSQSATLYQQNGASTPSHAWYIAPSGTAGNAITFTQAMTLEGTDRTNLLVGTTSSSFSAAGRGVFEIRGSGTSLVSLNAGSALAYIFNDGSNVNIQNNQAGVLQLSNNSAVRFQIGSAGQLGIGGATYGSSGQVLTSNGSGSAPSWQTAGGGGFGNMVVFTSGGTWTVPTGITKCKVTVTGGGGGSSPYSGGAAGGTAIAYVTLSGSSATITIGGAGAGGSSSGSAGGSSSFVYGATTLSGGGGSGGSNNSQASGGSGSGGTINIQGGSGTYLNGYGVAGSSVWGGGSNSNSTYGAGGLPLYAFGSPTSNNGAPGVVVIEY